MYILPESHVNFASFGKNPIPISAIHDELLKFKVEKKIYCFFLLNLLQLFTVCFLSQMESRFEKSDSKTFEISPKSC